jgi:hypothetical protein
MVYCLSVTPKSVPSVENALTVMLGIMPSYGGTLGGSFCGGGVFVGVTFPD